MDDLIALCEGLRAALPSVLAPAELPSAGAALDAAIEVYRWHRRLAGDARKRTRSCSSSTRAADRDDQVGPAGPAGDERRAVLLQLAADRPPAARAALERLRPDPDPDRPPGAAGRGRRRGVHLRGRPPRALRRLLRGRRLAGRSRLHRGRGGRPARASTGSRASSSRRPNRRPDRGGSARTGPWRPGGTLMARTRRPA